MTSGGPPPGPGTWSAAPGAAARTTPWRSPMTRHILRWINVSGVLILILGVLLFSVAIREGTTVKSENAVEVPHDGESIRFELLETTPYGFYSLDTSLRCTVTGPDGSAVTVRAVSLEGSAADPPQILGFSSGEAGTYAVSCTGAHPVTINTADMTPERERAAAMLGISLLAMALGTVVGTTGGILLFIWRRQVMGAMVARLEHRPPLQAGPQAHAGAAAGAQTPGPPGFAASPQAVPTSGTPGTHSAPRGGSVVQPAPGGHAAPWWQAATGLAPQGGRTALGGQPAVTGQAPQGGQAPGRAAPSGQPTPGPSHTGSPLPEAQSGADPVSPAGPGTPGAPASSGTPVTGDHPVTPPGSYGLAPQHVVYRQMPPPEAPH